MREKEQSMAIDWDDPDWGKSTDRHSNVHENGSWVEPAEAKED